MFQSDLLFNSYMYKKDYIETYKRLSYLSDLASWTKYFHKDYLTAKQTHQAKEFLSNSSSRSAANLLKSIALFVNIQLLQNACFPLCEPVSQK